MTLSVEQLLRECTNFSGKTLYIGLVLIYQKNYWEASFSLDRGMIEDINRRHHWNNVKSNLIKHGIQDTNKIECVEQYISHGFIFLSLYRLIDSIELYVSHIQESKKILEFFLEDSEDFCEDFNEILDVPKQEALFPKEEIYDNSCKMIDQGVENFINAFQSWSFLVDIGMYFGQHKDYLRAIRFYIAAIKIRVNVCNAYSQKSSALAAIGDYEGAQEDMAMAMKLMNS